MTSLGRDRFVQFAVAEDEKISGLGEDGPPVAELLPDLGDTWFVVGVTDGLGGAGSRQYWKVGADPADSKSGAWFAARWVSARIKDDAVNRFKYWTGAGGKEPWPDVLADNLTTYLREELAELRGSLSTTESRLVTKMSAELPTTLAMAIVERGADETRVAGFWSGDSRIYILSASGGLQLLTTDNVAPSVDDVPGAFIARHITETGSYADPPVAYAVKHGEGWKVWSRCVSSPDVLAVIAMSDGVYGGAGGPLGLERELCRFLAESDSAEAFKQSYLEHVKARKDDDISFACAFVSSWTAVQAVAASRLSQIADLTTGDERWPAYLAASIAGEDGTRQSWRARGEPAGREDRQRRRTLSVVEAPAAVVATAPTAPTAPTSVKRAKPLALPTLSYRTEQRDDGVLITGELLHDWRAPVAEASAPRVANVILRGAREAAPELKPFPFDVSCDVWAVGKEGCRLVERTSEFVSAEDGVAKFSLALKDVKPTRPIGGATVRRSSGEPLLLVCSVRGAPIAFAFLNRSVEPQSLHAVGRLGVWSGAADEKRAWERTLAAAMRLATHDVMALPVDDPVRFVRSAPSPQGGGKAGVVLLVADVADADPVRLRTLGNYNACVLPVDYAKLTDFPIKALSEMASMEPVDKWIIRGTAVVATASLAGVAVLGVQQARLQTAFDQFRTEQAATAQSRTVAFDPSTVHSLRIGDCVVTESERAEQWTAFVPQASGAAIECGIAPVAPAPFAALVATETDVRSFLTELLATTRGTPLDIPGGEGASYSIRVDDAQGLRWEATLIERDGRLLLVSEGRAHQVANEAAIRRFLVTRQS